MKLALLSNVNLDLCKNALSKQNEVFQNEGYGQWIQETIFSSDSMKSFNPDAIFLILDGFALLEGINDVNDVKAELQAAVQHVSHLSELYPDIPVFASNIDIRPSKILPTDSISNELRYCQVYEDELQRAISNHHNLHLFNLRKLIEDEGRKNVYSEKMWYLGSIPYSMKAISHIADSINLKILQYEKTRKKVLILDLDNTLWGGVLGEDDLDGIQLSRSLVGAAYRDAQLKIKNLAETGVLLAVVSKNNKEDVLSTLEKHPQMVLRPDDFVAIYANWEPKSKNIEALAQTLNLGLDSFVFLDDNPVERESVHIALPDVTIADFPADVSKLPKTIDMIAENYFSISRLTKEDTEKTQQYQQEAKRHAAMDFSASIEDYLKSLDIKIVINEMTEAQLERTAQLTQKTNQFNLRTARFSIEQMQEYAASKNNHVYVANVSDRFGDSGLVLVLMVSVNDDTASIDNFLMSCRVMGRFIEDMVIDAVENKLAGEGIKEIKAEYIPTAKNKPVSSLMERLDYQLIESCDEGNKIYSRILNSEKTLRKVIYNSDL